MTCLLGIPELDEKIGQWLTWDKNEKTRLAIKSLVEKTNINELQKLLNKRMEFGTAGLRARMGPGFSQMNDLTIIQTTQGLAKYLIASQPAVKKNGVVVGFDGRHNSYKWSRIVGAVFVNENIPVYLYSKLCPTPYVAFAVRKLSASAGVMITASHNPKEDNGYKVYWNNGAQIITPHDKGIRDAIEENLQPNDNIWKYEETLKNKAEMVIDPLDDMIKMYNEDALSLSHFGEKNTDCPVIFTYTAMHGVGYEYLKAIFKAFQFREPIGVPEQVQPDGDFPTVKYPNPEEGEGALKLAMATADKYGSKVILANDPDADRLAVAEKTNSGWRIFTGNEIGAFLGWWCWTAWRQKNPTEDVSNVYMLSSTVSSKILSAIAKKEGFNFIETLTGFKWMGNEADKLLREGKHVLFAFEEAIGYMVGSIVLDKDGITAAAVVAELVNHLYTYHSNLSKQLDIIYTNYGYHMSSNSYMICHDGPSIQAMFARLRNYDGKGNYPNACGRFSIKHVRDLTKPFDSETKDKKPILPTSASSEMITFKFDNGCVITLRTSGTEPKIKYYVEHRPKIGSSAEDTEKELKEIVKSIENDFYNTKEFTKILPRDLL